MGPGHTANAWMIVLVCLFASLPIYMFISGLLGWDDMALAEFGDAAELVPAPIRRDRAVGPSDGLIRFAA